MTLTLTESAGTTYIRDGDRPVGMAQLDPYGTGRWTSWRYVGLLTSSGYELFDYHDSRSAALAVFGWAER